MRVPVARTNTSFVHIQGYLNYVGPLMGYEFEIQDEEGYEQAEWNDGCDCWRCREAYERGEGYATGLVEHSYGKLPKWFSGDFETLGDKYGYEFRSPVANLPTHRRLWKEVLSSFKIYHDDPNDHEAGIHVNISSNSVTYHPKWFVALCTQYPDTFRRVGGREPWSFEEYCKSPLTEVANLEQDRVDDMSSGWTDWHHHYCVLNCEKSYAYEFRLFKAETKLLIPSLEMADAICSFSDKHPELEHNYLDSKNKCVVSLDQFHSYLKSKRKYAAIADIMTTVRANKRHNSVQNWRPAA